MKAHWKAPTKAHWKAHRKARRKAPSKARSRAYLKAHFRASLKARRKARIKAPRKAQLKARGKARRKARVKTRSEAQLKARVKAQIKARFKPRSRAAQWAVPPPWGGRENCGRGTDAPLPIDAGSSLDCGSEAAAFPEGRPALECGSAAPAFPETCRAQAGPPATIVRSSLRLRTRAAAEQGSRTRTARLNALPNPCNCRHIGGATGRRGQPAAERASQAGVRCRVHRTTDCGIERRAEFLIDGGAEFPGLSAVDGRARLGTRRAAIRPAKSLIDGHIDGRVVFGIECRGHSRSDPSLAGASAGLSLGPQAAGPAAASVRLGVLALGFCLLTFDLRVRRAL